MGNAECGESRANFRDLTAVQPLAVKARPIAGAETLHEATAISSQSQMDMAVSTILETPITPLSTLDLP